MYLSKIRLYNFRSYEDFSCHFCKTWNILVGENGCGKTNLLEAIYYSFTSRSPRTVHLKELINMNFSPHKFALNIEFKKDDINNKVSHKYLYENRKSHKNIQFNSKKVSILELVGKIPFVYFVPEDLNMIKGDSKFRRKLLDFILFQIYPSYKFSLTKYSGILKERNVLLRNIRDGKMSAELLSEWDMMLVDVGFDIFSKRQNLTKILNQKLKKSDNVYLKENELEIFYKSSVKSQDDFLARLRKNREREISYGVTLTGVHRDNLQFMLNGSNLKKFGSQGQQRLFILTLKILTAEVIFGFTKEKPILIFDDVFSELDLLKIKTLIDILGEKKYQVFVSSVSVAGFSDFFSNFDTKIFKIDELS
ncbi:MAG: DNA replication and repair protein RecF [bacterium]|nr:DNA replication and repair protein RecF [bacterium]